MVGLDSGSRSVNLYSSEVPTPVAVVVSAAASGIGQIVRRRCDLLASLLHSKVGRLNAATADDIALFKTLAESPRSRCQDPLA